MTEPPVDALLLVSFGGPEGPDDVLPFLRNVTRGRGVPDERLAEVAEHYSHFGGISPINDQNRALIAAVEADLAANGLPLPIYWGNRNWHPYLADTVGRMGAAGVRRALAFVTSAYSGYSSCRQYQEDIADARAVVGPSAPQIDKLRHYYNHPGFIAAMVDSTRAALAELPAAGRPGAEIVFVAHSVPTSMAASSGPAGDGYPTQLAEAARLVADGVGGAHPWQLAYSSRSGAPGSPWLEPDIGDHLDRLAARGVTDVVAVPIGFVSDHMEVRYDLDVEARARAASLGLRLARAATVGTAPDFVAVVRELVLEHTVPGRPRQALGRLGAGWDVCPPSCCLADGAHRRHPLGAVFPPGRAADVTLEGVRRCRGGAREMDEQVRELLARLTERVRAAFLEIVAEVRRLTAPLLAMWARMAIRRWEQVQRVFAEHRDLVETDGWLDRWYSFGTG